MSYAKNNIMLMLKIMRQYQSLPLLIWVKKVRDMAANVTYYVMGNPSYTQNVTLHMKNSQTTEGLFGKDNMAIITQSGRVTIQSSPFTIGVSSINPGSHTACGKYRIRESEKKKYLV